VAGEEGVTPVTPKTRPKTGQPAPVKPPPRTRAQPRPEPAKEKAVQEKAVPKAQKAPRAAKSDDRYVTIDFDNVDISLFVKFISELTGKNFVIDKAVKGKVTIISPTKITVQEAYRVFESVLEVHGYTTVPAGKIIKIVPAVAARGKDIETRLREEALTPEDKVVTQLVPLRYADPNELKKLFAPLISKSSVIVSYPPTGMLIVTDVQSNIRRLLSIIEAIDVPGIGEEISVVPLEYATASVMAKSLNEVFQRTAKARKGAVGAPVIKIVPDERTNVLILLASEDDTAKVAQLIALLDKETPRGEGDIHVYYLQNANAEDLAKVLMAIPAQQAKAPKKGAAPVISKEVQIVPDKATNALVITAKKDDFLVLEDVIRQLDIARRMVYIEALLMEVSMNKDFKLGVQWQFAETIGSSEGKDVAGFGASLAGDILTPLGTGFSLGILGEAINISGVDFPSIAAVIKAVEQDTDVNILSTPQIMTTDNEEAEIIVAKNIPFQTRVETGGEGTLGREFATFEYRDVGVTLNITPQISQARFVRLKITEVVEQVIEEESALGLPTTLKREAKTTVIVQDGHTVVIGGLIDRTTTEGTTKTPCLGNIPGLGWLFKAVSTRDDRQNLYFFLTPHIVENPQEARALYEEKKEKIDRIKAGVVKLYEGGGEQTEDMRLSDLGYQFLEAKDYDKAKQYLEKALEINPENPYALLNMGVVYEAKGKREEAIEMYEKVITLAPEDRAFESTDSEQIGHKLSDIATDNLKRLKEEGK
jgi:general secretion pathway protein D